MTDVDLNYLARQNAEILEEVRALRREVDELRAAASKTVDYNRRNDPRRPNSLTQR